MTHQWIKILAEAKKTYFEGILGFFHIIKTLTKNVTLVFDLYDRVSSCKDLEKSYEPSLRKTVY